jgi:hypothetical protein
MARLHYIGFLAGALLAGFTTQGIAAPFTFEHQDCAYPVVFPDKPEVNTVELGGRTVTFALTVIEGDRAGFILICERSAQITATAAGAEAATVSLLGSQGHKGMVVEPRAQGSAFVTEFIGSPAKDELYSDRIVSAIVDGASQALMVRRPLPSRQSKVALDFLAQGSAFGKVPLSRAFQPLAPEAPRISVMDDPACMHPVSFPAKPDIERLFDPDGEDTVTAGVENERYLTMAVCLVDNSIEATDDTAKRLLAENAPQDETYDFAASYTSRQQNGDLTARVSGAQQTDTVRLEAIITLRQGSALILMAYGAAAAEPQAFISQGTGYGAGRPSRKPAAQATSAKITDQNPLPGYFLTHPKCPQRIVFNKQPDVVEIDRSDGKQTYAIVEEDGVLLQMTCADLGKGAEKLPASVHEQLPAVTLKKSLQQATDVEGMPSKPGEREVARGSGILLGENGVKQINQVAVRVVGGTVLILSASMDTSRSPNKIADAFIMQDLR